MAIVRHLSYLKAAAQTIRFRYSGIFPKNGFLFLDDHKGCLLRGLSPIGNTDQNWRFAYWAKLMVYKWLNRRSQRKSFNVTSFVAAWERWQIPMPRVVEEPLPRTAGHDQPRSVLSHPTRVRS